MYAGYLGTSCIQGTKVPREHLITSSDIRKQQRARSKGAVIMHAWNKKTSSMQGTKAPEDIRKQVACKEQKCREYVYRDQRQGLGEQGIQR
jgi:hypothetical protein